MVAYPGPGKSRRGCKCVLGVLVVKVISGRLAVYEYSIVVKSVLCSYFSLTLLRQRR